MTQKVCVFLLSDDEVAVIREYLFDNGRLDFDDIKFLVGMLCDARQVCPAFDELFFPVLKDVILADGKIENDEHFYLLKMLYSDGHVRDSEREFVLELRDEARAVSPEFEALCAQLPDVPARDWSVGGTRGGVEPRCGKRTDTGREAILSLQKEHVGWTSRSRAFKVFEIHV